MKGLFPKLILTSFSGLIITFALPIYSGNCSNHLNQTECNKSDLDCQSDNSNNIDINRSVDS